MKRGFLLLTACAALTAHAQFADSFDDGNFTTAPAWSGTAEAWTVAANSEAGAGAPGANVLRLAAPVGSSGVKYLGARVEGSWGSQQRWSCWIGRRAQAATASNNVCVWLWASEGEVTAASADGYRIRFGDDNGGDEVVLERVVDGTVSAIITSAGSVPNGLTDIGLAVVVTRSPTGLWSLYTSPLPRANGSGTTAAEAEAGSYERVLQGSATDLTVTDFTNGYIAVSTQHTASAAARGGLEVDALTMDFSVSGALPVRIDALSGQVHKERIILSWNSLEETGVQTYVVERSVEGHGFQSIGRLSAKKNAGGSAAYRFTDHSPQRGCNRYRLRIEEGDGTIGFSTVLPVLFDRSVRPQPTLYPNPSNGGPVKIHWPGAPPGRYVLTLVSADGGTVWRQRIQQGQAGLQQTLELRGLSPGNYYLILEGPINKTIRLLHQP